MLLKLCRLLVVVVIIKSLWWLSYFYIFFSVLETPSENSGPHSRHHFILGVVLTLAVIFGLILTSRYVCLKQNLQEIIVTVHFSSAIQVTQTLHLCLITTGSWLPTAPERISLRSHKDQQAAVWRNVFGKWCWGGAKSDKMNCPLVSYLYCKLFGATLYVLWGSKTKGSFPLRWGWWSAAPWYSLPQITYNHVV